MFCARLIFLFAMVFIAGCTSIDADKIAKFGASATAMGDALSETRSIQNNLQQKIDLELEATRYVRGSSKFLYPPPRKESLSVGFGWNSRINFANALAAYGKALAEAAKGAKEAEIGEAVDGLQKAVVAAVPNGSSNKSLAAAGKASSSLARFIYRQASVDSARDAIVAVDPLIKQGAKLLEGDFDALSEQATIRFEAWKKSKRAALLTFQNDHQASTVEKYDAYEQFALEEREMAATVALLVSMDGVQPKYKTLLSAMVSAHGELARPGSSEDALDQFVKSIDELADVFSVLKG